MTATLSAGVCCLSIVTRSDPPTFQQRRMSIAREDVAALLRRGCLRRGARADHCRQRQRSARHVSYRLARRR